MQTLTTDDVTALIATRAHDIGTEAARVLTEITPALRDQLPTSRLGRARAALTRLRHRVRNDLAAGYPFNPVAELVCTLAVLEVDIPQARTTAHSAWVQRISHAAVEQFLLDDVARYGWWATADGDVIHWPVTIDARWVRGCAGFPVADLAAVVDRPVRACTAELFRAGAAHVDAAGDLHIIFPGGTAATMPASLANSALRP